MKINELDVVRLKDGRKGTVLEIYDGGKSFLVEFTDEYGRTVDMPIVYPEQIEKVVFNAKNQT